MNRSTQEVFRVTCDVFGATHSRTIDFQSEQSFVNLVFLLVFNGVIIIPTILLNAIAILTILKCSQLKSKPCYFIIAVQSTIDLAVGVLGIPLFLLYILDNTGVHSNCVIKTLAYATAILMIDISTIVISTMTFERYVAVLHPFTYKTLVTTKRILWCVCIGSLVFSSALTISQFFRIVMDIWIVVQSTLFCFFAGFAHIRIFMVVKDLSRSQPKADDAIAEGNLTKKKEFLQDVRHAKSCFIVVSCFVILHYLPVISLVSFKHAKTLNLHYYHDFNVWVVTLGLLNSSVNSVIFFWTKTVLRKEAAKILRSLYSFVNELFQN